MFFFDSVDNVLSDIKAKLERLQKIQQREAERAIDLEDDAAILLADAREARNEVARAQKVAAKFSKFLED